MIQCGNMLLSNSNTNKYTYLWHFIQVTTDIYFLFVQITIHKSLLRPQKHKPRKWGTPLDPHVRGCQVNLVDIVSHLQNPVHFSCYYKDYSTRFTDL